MTKGQTHSLESIAKMQAVHRLIPTWNDGSRGALTRIEQCRQMGQKYGRSIPKSPEVREKIALAQIGDKGHNWKGGKTREHDRIRHSWKYKLWKKTVLERDDYRCIQCGTDEYLHVDHIKPFAWYPELRFDVNNGRVLCYDCHKQTKTWGPRYHSSALQASA